ncbi:MAG: shikimate kinase [Candidatus Cloacimonetes bacterium]|nr:shikimate kinase [Candidatus Cloacimonadota bacterium]
MQDLIILIGFMGSGKTFLGNKLAQLLSVDFYDLDREMEVRTKMTIPEFFTQFGEKKFRQLESRVFLNWKLPGVIATGGGLVDLEINRKFLKSDNKLVVWLDPDWDVIWSRISETSRPLVKKHSDLALKELWIKRCPYYRESCDIRYQDHDPSRLRDLIYNNHTD